MKPVKLSIAVLSALSIVSLSGCAAFADTHLTTQSNHVSEQEQALWTDRTWRKAISQRWREEDRRLSRQRLAELFD